MNDVADLDFSSTFRNTEENDRSLFVTFFFHPRQNEALTAKEGRPIFEDTEYIRIVIAGDRNNVVCRPASPEDKRRFHLQYRAFKDLENSETPNGTPLEQWPLVSRSFAEEMRFFKIFTVEQLATVSDQQCQKIMGLSGMRQKAQAYLAATNDSKAGEAIQKELSERDGKIALLETRLLQMEEELAQFRRKT